MQRKKPLYFEDFTPGMCLESGSYTIERESSVAFATEYDPQYFHTNEEAARGSVFGQLVVSGWQTAAISMRLKAESRLGRIEGGLIGLGMESMRWPRAVYPGDTLSLAITILETRPSASKPSHGVIRYKVETFNQDGAAVMEVVISVLALRRPG